MPVWAIQIIIAVIMALLAYAFAPKPKSPKPDTSQELTAPTADAGRPVPVVFGSVTVQSPNCLWYGDVSTTVEKVKV
jgi:hypothetical protein